MHENINKNKGKSDYFKNHEEKLTDVTQANETPMASSLSPFLNTWIDGLYHAGVISSPYCHKIKISMNIKKKEKIKHMVTTGMMGGKHN